MDIITVILQYIFVGISKLLKFIWAKWRLAGILAIILIVELLILAPVYENVVNDQIRTVQDFDIVAVEQTDNPEDRERLFITVENKSGSTLTRLPMLKLEIDEMSYFLDTESIYEDLINNGYRLYRGNSIPPGSKAKVIYKFSGFLPDDEMAAGKAKIVVDDYSYDVKTEYSFDLKPTKGMPDASR